MYVIISFKLDITIFGRTLYYINNLKLRKLLFFYLKKYSIHIEITTLKNRQNIVK